MKITPLGWLYFAAAAALFIVAYPVRNWPAREIERLVEPAALAGVRSWQLVRGVDVVEANIDEASDLIVVGAAAGDADAPFSAAQVRRLQRHSDGSRRLVLASLSIGAVGDNRKVTGDPVVTSAAGVVPRWLGPETCPNSGVRSVRFWQEDWKQRLYTGTQSRLSRIVAAGFDGVYLTHLDPDRFQRNEQPTAERDMLDLVLDLAMAARRSRPGFQILPEGGEMFLRNAGYRSAIDGIAQTDLIFSGGADEEPNSLEAISYSFRLLRYWRQRGIPALVVERLSDPARIGEARGILRSWGFAPAFERASAVGRPDERRADCDGSAAQQ